MARRSAADLNTPVIGELPRPAAPERLSPEGKRIWDETVNALNPDWFASLAGCEPLMAVYCEAVALNQRLATMVSSMSDGDPRWPELVRLYHADCTVLLRLACALRLTPSSRPAQGYEGRGAARPWDDLGEGGKLN